MIVNVYIYTTFELHCIYGNHFSYLVLYSKTLIKEFA